MVSCQICGTVDITIVSDGGRHLNLITDSDGTKYGICTTCLRKIIIGYIAGIYDNDRTRRLAMKEAALKIRESDIDLNLFKSVM